MGSGLPDREDFRGGRASMEVQSNSTKWTPEVKRLVARRLVQLAMYVVVTSLILFGVAGTIYWFGAWA